MVNDAWFGEQCFDLASLPVDRGLLLQTLMSFHRLLRVRDGNFGRLDARERLAQLMFERDGQQPTADVGLALALAFGDGAADGQQPLVSRVPRLPCPRPLSIG